ncbi:endoplasmic reticulum retention protein [Phlyctochytrium planicorne]|nr:endoplasmic reticulum retention protein [Phlyctochytrium planicorne]
MNIFRFVADMAHLASICILLLKMTQTRSASGISFKSQALYLTVFITRYLDLFFKFHSLYNTLMKLVFIGTSGWICYAMQTRYRATWDPALDTLRVEYLVGPSALLALIFNYGFKFLEVLQLFENTDTLTFFLLSAKKIFWAFSIYLEAVAILPQLFQLTRTGECETINTHYLFALGTYRGLYILNWIYRYFFDDPPYEVEWIAILAGLVQTGLYCDFFYIYFTKVLQGRKFRLPA